ncbi:MAG: hypothetical protein ABFR95_01765 [Actinomycetota bacterium]
MNSSNPVHYLPVITTIVAVMFTTILIQKWREKPDAKYLLWWAIGVAAYGVGTLTEALTTVFGWSEPVFRAWYISGALLGGAPLATGTVFLMLSRRRATWIASIAAVYVAVASFFILVAPIDASAVDPHRLSGQVFEWQWVRLFSPLINLYAVVFLIGGALLSAWRYWRRDGAGAMVIGNLLIAVGAILPGIGGTYARLGHIEVLYVTELVGLSLIWLGSIVIGRASAASVHEAQLRSQASSAGAIAS